MRKSIESPIPDISIGNRYSRQATTSCHARSNLAYSMSKRMPNATPHSESDRNALQAELPPELGRNLRELAAEVAQIGADGGNQQTLEHATLLMREITASLRGVWRGVTGDLREQGSVVLKEAFRSLPVSLAFSTDGTRLVSAGQDGDL